MDFEKILSMPFGTVATALFFLYCFSLSWPIQVRFGNYLKHTHPQSWLRKVWWSMCDNDGVCEICDTHFSRRQLWLLEHEYHD